MIHHPHWQHQQYHNHDDQVRAGAGVAAPPGAVSAGTGKGLVCRLTPILNDWKKSKTLP